MFNTLPHSSLEECLTKFTPRSDCSIQREIAKYPRATHQTPQVSVSMLNVDVHGNTIRITLNNYG